MNKEPQPVDITLSKAKYRRGWAKGKYRSDYNGNSGLHQVPRGSLPKGIRRRKRKTKGGFGHL